MLKVTEVTGELEAGAVQLKLQVALCDVNDLGVVWRISEPLIRAPAGAPESVPALVLRLNPAAVCEVDVLDTVAVTVYVLPGTQPVPGILLVTDITVAEFADPPWQEGVPQPTVLCPVMPLLEDVSER